MNGLIHKMPHVTIDNTVPAPIIQVHLPTVFHTLTPPAWKGFALVVLDDELLLDIKPAVGPGTGPPWLSIASGTEFVLLVACEVDVANV